MGSGSGSGSGIAIGIIIVLLKTTPSMPSCALNPPRIIIIIFSTPHDRGSRGDAPMSDVHNAPPRPLFPSNTRPLPFHHDLNAREPNPAYQFTRLPRTEFRIPR